MEKLPIEIIFLIWKNLNKVDRVCFRNCCKFNRKYLPETVQLVDDAIKFGDVCVLNYYKENVPDDVAIKAIEYGHLNVLQWATENGYNFEEWTCEAAARCRRLDMLKWLNENRCEFHVVVCDEAAWNEDTEILLWLRSIGCDWDANICYIAARLGNLDMLKWLLDEGCPCDESACEGAIDGDHVEIVDWIWKNNLPWPKNVPELIYFG